MVPWNVAQSLQSKTHVYLRNVHVLLLSNTAEYLTMYIWTHSCKTSCDPHTEPMFYMVKVKKQNCGLPMLTFTMTNANDARWPPCLLGCCTPSLRSIGISGCLCCKLVISILDPIGCGISLCSFKGLLGATCGLKAELRWQKFRSGRERSYKGTNPLSQQITLSPSLRALPWWEPVLSIQGPS